MDRVRELVHTKETIRQGYTGRGIRIALLDTGVAIHPDLQGKVAVFRDFVNGRQQMYDDNGHGTHIAGILCGSGAVSRKNAPGAVPMRTSAFTIPQTVRCGKYAGMAPGAELIVCKILDQKGNGSTQTALAALQWIGEHREAYRIRLLNFSMGYLPDIKRQEQRSLLDAVDALWDAGIAVVTAAGNNGPKAGSVTVPGISRNVITVGASDDNQSFSGSGPTDCCIVKPEILAPGTNITSLDARTGRYTIKSGTSMAVPVVCGALALALEKDASLSPAILKLALYESVDREPTQLFQNCWGMLNVDRLLRML